MKQDLFKKNKRIHLLLLALLTLGAFTAAFNNGFINWDDEEYILNNPLIRNLTWNGIVYCFTHSYASNYNPLHIVSYMLDYALWGFEYRGYLAFNLLLHIAAGVFVWKIFLRLSSSRFVAAFCSLFFLIHPTRCESVVWISERKDILSVFFAVISLWYYLKWIDCKGIRSETGNGKWMLYGLSLSFFLAGLFAKSQIVTLPLIFAAIALYRKHDWKSILVEQMPFCLLSMIFGVLTILVHAEGSSEIFHGTTIFGLDLIHPFQALLVYLGNIFFPINLSPVSRYTVDVGLKPWLFVPGIIMLGGVIWIAFKSFSKKRIFFAGSCWFLFLLVPVSGLIPNYIFTADRYLYFSIVGPAWITAELLRRYVADKRIQYTALSAVAVVFLLLTSSYCTVWRTPERFWKRVLEHYPDHFVAQSNLGNYYVKTNRYEKAEALFKTDLKQGPPTSFTSYLGLANIYYQQNRLDEAESIHRRFIRDAPGDALFSLAVVYYAAFLNETDRPEQALDVLREHKPKRLTKYKKTISLHGTRALIYYKLNQLGKAREEAALSTRYNPLSIDCWYKRGFIEEKAKNFENALLCHQKALAINPGFMPAHTAIAKLQKAIKKNSGNPAGPGTTLSEKVLHN